MLAGPHPTGSRNNRCIGGGFATTKPRAALGRLESVMILQPVTTKPDRPSILLISGHEVVYITKASQSKGSKRIFKMRLHV